MPTNLENKGVNPLFLAILSSRFWFDFQNEPPGIRSVAFVLPHTSPVRFHSCYTLESPYRLSISAVVCLRMYYLIGTLTASLHKQYITCIWPLARIFSVLSTKRGLITTILESNGKRVRSHIPDIFRTDELTFACSFLVLFS